MNIPNQSLPPGATIHPFSVESIGAELNAALTAPAAAVWPGVNQAFYVPFHLETPLVVAKLASGNGAAASGNIDMGIYTHDGTRLVSSGSTAMSASANVVQVLDITDTLLGAGDYYLALACDNTTAQFFRLNPSFLILRRAAVLQQASAFPLPAVATMAALASGYVPMVALLQKGVVI